MLRGLCLVALLTIGMVLPAVAAVDTKDDPDNHGGMNCAICVVGMLYT